MPIIGIDLGTSNSAAVMLRGGSSRKCRVGGQHPLLTEATMSQIPEVKKDGRAGTGTLDLSQPLYFGKATVTATV